VFSFVFGDGDPNGDVEARRWTAVGSLLQSAGGVVTAEQLAPLLEPPRPLSLSSRSASLAGVSAYADESFVLPALTRLGGVPEVTSAGGILYRFPDLQKTGSKAGIKAGSAAARPPPLRERAWEFTGAPAGNVVGAVLLGVANAAGVIWLSSLLGSPAVAARAGADTMAALRPLLPVLQAYAALFFAIPAARWTGLQRTNAAIESRNEARRDAANALAAPPPAVAAKLAAARAGGARTAVADAKVVFSSDASDSKAAAAADADEGAEFERRLADREKRRKNQ
jgi:hypothetical protein